MSGIYIPDWDKPEICTDCPCFNEYTQCCQVDIMADIDSCPLIPVPDHGDLIDRGYAIATACSGLTTTEDGERWIRVKEVRESIKAAPTIIPARLEETDK